jgi:hypothetical protein
MVTVTLLRRTSIVCGIEGCCYDSHVILAYIRPDLPTWVGRTRWAVATAQPDQCLLTLASVPSPASKATQHHAFAAILSRQCASNRNAPRAAKSSAARQLQKVCPDGSHSRGMAASGIRHNSIPQPLCQTRSKIETRTLLCMWVQPPDSPSVQLSSARETDVLQRYMTFKLFLTVCLPASTACRRGRPPDLPMSGLECLQVRAADCARLRSTERPRISRGCGSPAPWRR